LVAAVDFFALAAAGPAVVAALSALLFAGLRFWLDYGRGIPARQSHPVAAGLALLLLLNGVVHLFVIPSPWQVGHVVVSLVGAGCLLLSARWLAAVVAGSITVWAAAAWFALPREEWIGVALVAWAASVVGLATHRARVSARREIETAERRNRAREHSTFDLLDTAIAVVDRYGNMLGASRAWQQSQELHLFGASQNGSKLNYLSVLDQAASDHVGEASDIAAGVRKVLSGKEHEFSYEYSHPATPEKRWFRLRAGRLKGVEKERILVAVSEITARKESERRAREY
jgi:PAS domain-containing protein